MQLDRAPTKTYDNGERGRYHCQCTCGRRFIGRKDDVICPSCALTAQYSMPRGSDPCRLS